MKRPPIPANASLLMAAAGLPQPFTEAALCVAAWKADPKAFGMRKAELQYPSDNRVRAAIVGRRGLIDRGYLQKVKPLVYRVTPQAVAEADRLRAGGTPRLALPTVRVPAHVEPTVIEMLADPCFQLHQRGPEWHPRITGTMADRFRSLVGFQWEHNDMQMSTLAVLRACLVPDEEGVGTTTLSNLQVVIAEDVLALEGCLAWVADARRAWNRGR